MEFLSLEKGDKDNLEGRVIVYTQPKIGDNEIKEMDMMKDVLAEHPDLLSKIDPSIDPDFLKHINQDMLKDMLKDIDPNMIVAMYATSNITDLKEKFSSNMPSDLESRINKEIKENYAKLPKGQKIENYFCGMFFTSLDDIKNSKEDIINLGQGLSPKNFHMASIGAVQFYMAQYNQQREAKANYSKAKQTSEKITPMVTYNDMQSDQRITHIQSDYIAPLMLEFERNNLEQAKQISQNFIRYSEGSPLEDDSYAIAAVLNFDKPELIEYKSPLLSNYFSKIIAITQEKYKEAAQYRDAIRDIQNKIQNKIKGTGHNPK
ncbi:MAG: hypothetical protein PHH54_00955 [Candidatus Nanoarchaeia archaeon]|nr:hypothetical protein [Candidatus Nanoarchaeia archaeon]MDD5740532.1 hypothetical protein [Candidatus Nanoarchaeia archaeon]